MTDAPANVAEEHFGPRVAAFDRWVDAQLEHPPREFRRYIDWIGFDPAIAHHHRGRKRYWPMCPPVRGSDRGSDSHNPSDDKAPAEDAPNHCPRRQLRQILGLRDELLLLMR